MFDWWFPESAALQGLEGSVGFNDGPTRCRNHCISAPFIFTIQWEKNLIDFAQAVQDFFALHC